MSSKDKVLEFLENNREDYISGEAMATSLGLSRNSIWKAINELRKAGYNIDAISNKGYKLAGANDIISAAGIMAEFNDDASANLLERILVFDNVDSTNKVAKEMAISGCASSTLVVAKTQGTGKAHKQGVFQSPDGGIYMSIILTPENLALDDSASITGDLGQKVANAISSCCGITPTIKPINNLYVDDKKVCGILTESGQEFDSGLVQWIVIGIGIYFDADTATLPSGVGSLFAPGTAPVSKNALIAKIYQSIIDII